MQELMPEEEIKRIYIIKKMHQTGQAITWITVIYTISVDQISAFKKFFTKR
jgi:hypothetical protein